MKTWRKAWPMGLFGIGMGVLAGYLIRWGVAVWVVLAVLVALALPLATLSAYLTERLARWRKAWVFAPGSPMFAAADPPVAVVEEPSLTAWELYESSGFSGRHWTFSCRNCPLCVEAVVVDEELKTYRVGPYAYEPAGLLGGSNGRCPHCGTSAAFPPPDVIVRVIGPSHQRMNRLATALTSPPRGEGVFQRLLALFSSW